MLVHGYRWNESAVTVTALTRRSAVDGIRKERRGFASMSSEKQREIASKGGRAAHEKGTAHEWTRGRSARRRTQGRADQSGRTRPALVATASPADVVLSGRFLHPEWSLGE